MNLVAGFIAFSGPKDLSLLDGLTGLKEEVKLQTLPTSSGMKSLSKPEYLQ